MPQITPSQKEFVFKQLALTMAASLGYLTIGLVRGYSSTAVPSMQDTANYLVPDENIVSWVSSIPPAGACIGSLVAGPFLQRVGRKRTLILISPLFAISWFTIGFSVNTAMLLVARFITGFCVGITLPSAQIYVSECSNPEVRGILGSFPALFMSGGILISYGLGAWLPWNELAYASAVCPILLILVLFPLPESPSWLLAKGRFQEADNAMAWLKHPPRTQTNKVKTEDEKNTKTVLSDAPEYIPQSLEMETKKKDIYVIESPKEKSKITEIFVKPPKLTIKDFLRRPVFLPFLISLILLVFQQVSGIDAIIFYTVTIFKSAHTPINDNLATIIVGLVQLLTNFVSLFIIDKMGRRPLLLVSGAGMGISMTALGTYFFLDSKGSSEGLGLLPLISLIVFMITFSVGYCSIPFLLMGELLPSRTRSHLSSIAGSFNLGMMFIVIKTYHDLKELMGQHGTFWLYAGLCICSCIFVLIFVPETKGKSLDEIETYFEDKNIRRKEKLKQKKAAKENES